MTENPDLIIPFGFRRAKGVRPVAEPVLSAEARTLADDHTAARILRDVRREGEVVYLPGAEHLRLD